MSNISVNIITENLTILLRGFLLTIGISTGGFVLATVIAVTLVAIHTMPWRPLRAIYIGYVEVLRGFPLPVLFIWLYYALPIISGYKMTALTAGIVGIALQIGAYVADDYIGATEAIPFGQYESARTLGLSRASTSRRIVAPQAIRVTLPNMVNNYIFALKGSALLTVISVPELMHQSQKLAQATYRPFEVLTFAALLYLVLSGVVAIAGRRAESVLNRKVGTVRAIPA